MEKQVTELQKCEKKLEDKKLRKGPASSLKISIWDSFQFLFVQTNHHVSPLVEYRL